MSNTKENMSDKVRILFKKIPWKKILTFSFFVLLATTFWVMQIYRQTFNATIHMPIKYTNIPDSIAFEHNLPLIFTVTIEDDGAALFKYFFTKRNDSLLINVRDLIQQSELYEIQKKSFGQLIKNNLFESTKLIDYTPSRAYYAYAVLQQKKLPVIYNGYINLASGYIVEDNLLLSPDSIYAYGSKASLDTLYFAHTIADTINNVNSTRKVVVGIQSTTGVKYTPTSIEVTIPVDKFLSREVDVPITCINLPERINVRFIPPLVKVPFFVGEKKDGDVKTSDFAIKVDYNEIKNIKRIPSSIPIRITESPDYIKTNLPIPAEVEFIFEEK